MDASEQYRFRRESWSANRSASERLFIMIGNARLALGILEAILAYLVFGIHAIPAWPLLLPVLAFICLAVWHSRVDRRRTLADRALRFYDRGLARLNDAWIGGGATGERFRDPSHIYSDDLDIFGQGSLFEMLAETRTAAGQAELAKWLLAPAPYEEACGRQAAVAELEGRLELREDLALLGPDVQAEVHIEALHRWATAPVVIFAPVLRWIAAALACVSLYLVYAFFSQSGSVVPLALAIAADFLFAFALRSKVSGVLAAAETVRHGLPILSHMLARLEREKFTSPRLQQILANLQVEGDPASLRVARLARWIDWLDSSDHALIRALRPLVLYREQIAIGLENWRRRSGPLVTPWLHAVAEFEALSSFASLRFENQEWCFPQLLSTPNPHFEARDLRHPLLPRSNCVGNNLDVTGDLRLLIVSGSNMSGKSTFLRAVGLNAVLAWAGGPVAAQSMRISRLQTGASIRVTDSLLDNRSRFFAEITRIREIVDRAKDGQPVLFLLDELLSGTNSHDRRIGAAAIVRKLVRLDATGLITTHDLALAHIQDDLGPAALNAHFDDQIVRDQITFDYRLRPGVVTHSNALELMRAVGLEV